LAASNRGTVALSEFTAMAKGHTYFWRQPGRRDAERKSFARLMATLEKIRLRDGLTLRVLAAEIGTTRDVVGEWLAEKSIGRKESVAKIKDFLQRRA
jgi:hypothetical protein